MKKLTFKHTVYACYLGYIVQAIGNNFAPLLFVTFSDSFGIPTEKITLLIALNFTVQLLVDLAAAKLADRIGYRPAVVAANVFSAVGIAGLALFPRALGDPFAGLLLAVFCYAVGGFDKPYRRVVSGRRKGVCNEYSSFILLLGHRFCHSRFNRRVRRIRRRLLGDDGAFVGGGPRADGAFLLFCPDTYSR